MALRDALHLREWTIGSLLWIIWKHRNKEIYDDEDYIFRPDSLTDALTAQFDDYHLSF